MNNPFNDCVDPQSAYYLPTAFPRKLLGVQTNMVSIIRPPFPPNSVQPNPNELPPIEQSIQYGPHVSTVPSFFHPSYTPYSITPIDMMDVEQTGNWISTLGWSKGWKEAETYAKNLRKSGISGKALQELTPQMLEFHLGVTDVMHRRELLCTIGSLYPQSTALAADSFCSVPRSLSTTATKTFKSTWVVNDGSPSKTRCTSYINLKYLVLSEGHQDSDIRSERSFSRGGRGLSLLLQRHLPKQQQSHAEVPVSANGGLVKQKLTAGKFESGELTEKYEKIIKMLKKTSIHHRRKAGYKKLILKLRPCQMWQDKAAIRQRLRDFKFTVDKIEENEGVDASYILVFPNGEMAKNVFLKAADLDYKLLKK